MAFIFGTFILLALVLGTPILRRYLVSRILFPISTKMLLKTGKTELVAVEAGTVCLDDEFSFENPRWKRPIHISIRQGPVSICYPLQSDQSTGPMDAELSF